MANRTVKEAATVKGTNPQYLIEKIIRSRIYDSKFWKEDCFALTAELLVDKAMELKYIGGVYGGNIKPSPFLCLTLKMLQIQPDKDIIVEFIKTEDFKYVRCLGAFYMRLTGSSIDCYKYLEPLYNDFRKIKIQNRDGNFELTHIDEYIDSLLHSDRVCDVILPRIQKRNVLEENEKLEMRISALDDDLDDLGESSDDEPPLPEPDKLELARRHRSPSPFRRRPHGRRRSPVHRYRRSRSRSRSPRHKNRSRSRSPRRHSERVRSSHSAKPRKQKSDKERSKKKKKKNKKDRKSDKNVDAIEIQEANELRAKLGLKPLK